jgi:HAE1 family hydrophobic/amphiphilic exporter-1
MRNITSFSVKYPVTVLMMILGIILLGYISYDKLGTDLFPNLTNPHLYIEMKAGERPPEEIEKQYIEPIEAQASRQEGVLSVSSTSKVGRANISIEYNWEQDMDAAFLDIQKALSSYSQNEDISEFNISRYDPNAEPIMLIALEHESITNMNELRKTAETYIRNELIRIEGIADVNITGQEKSEILVKTNDYLLKSYGLTTNDIVTKIRSLDRNISGGKITEGGIQYTVKGVKIIDNINDLENVIIGFSSKKQATNNASTQVKEDKAPIYLKDIATVKLVNKEPDNIVYYNGKRCLGLNIYKETKFNTVSAIEKLSVSLKDIEKALPGYKFHVIRNQGKFISDAINEVKDSAITGILLAMVVLFIFLRRINTTLIVSISIPISIIATFNLMYFNGLSLNIMTLGGLALGAGMLVDNAIVVMESIFRNIEKGLSPKEAAIKGTSEVAGAITASTITTIVVFLPIVYLHGASGELFKDQAWTVAFSLLSSLFVAILVIPMLSSKFIKAGFKPKAKEANSKFAWYADFLDKVIAKRYPIIISTFVIVGASILLVPLIGSDFMPKTESKKFAIKVTLPEGSDLRKTASTVKSVESMVRDVVGDDLHYIYSHTGPSMTSSASKGSQEDKNTANIDIKLKEDSKLAVGQLMTYLDKNIKGHSGINIEFKNDKSALSSVLGTDEAPIVIEVYGKDAKELEKISKQINQKLHTNDKLYEISSSFEKGAPEIDVKIDRLRAGVLGIDINNVTAQIKDILSGKEAGSIEKGGELKNIRIALPEVNISQLSNLEVISGGKKYRLAEIAKIEMNYSPKQIERKAQNRIGKISANLRKGAVLDKVVADVKKDIATIDLPSNYRIKIGGEEAKRAESFGSLAFALMLSIILVYMVMASQFESLVHPFTILLSIPLAVAGSLFSFFILGQSLNIMAYIGIIMLVGIAVNDSIILVDAINRLKGKGMELKEAIKEAGLQRIRPIIMTSLTTILALLPLTFGFGESAALRSPMAIAVIGGLITSTLLTLIVIPCLYYTIDRLFVKK